MFGICTDEFEKYSFVIQPIRLFLPGDNDFERYVGIFEGGIYHVYLLRDAGYVFRTLYFSFFLFLFCLEFPGESGLGL